MLKLVPLPIRQYAVLDGRMTRSQYFRWLGILLVVYIVCAWVDLRFIAPALGYLPFEEVEEAYLTWLAGLLLVVPWFASNVRRLHDTNRTGWWMVLVIPPLLVLYFSEYMYFSIYSYVTEGIVADLIPTDIKQMLIDQMLWVNIGIAAILFSPVIYWSLKKGSSEPNRFGARQ